MDHDEIRAWLEHVPRKLLLSEVGRRNSESRTTRSGGKPKVLKPCPRCGKVLGTRERAKACPAH